MKKIAAFLLAVVLLLSMAACQPSDSGGVNAKIDPDGMEMVMGQTYSDHEGVSVQITNAVWDESGFVLEVDWINKTSYEGIFGASYIIERKEGEEWVSCQTVDDLVFIALAYVLSPKQTREETYHVSRMFDVSKASTYRFRSNFSINDKANQTVWAEFTLGERLEGDNIKTQEPVNYGAQYIRTNGYQEGAKFPRVVIIRSRDELNSYYEANKDTFDLERNDKVYSDTTIGFLDACDKYDAEYFTKGYLVFVLLEEGSGSIRHEVTGSTISSDGVLGVYIDTITPEAGTCDMAEWHIILEMSNAVAVKDENAVQVYLDSITTDKEHTHQAASAPQNVDGPVVGYCGNTQTTLYIDGENYTFMYDESVTLTDILLNLDYDPNKLCKCLPEYMIDTEFGKGYGVKRWGVEPR